MNSRPKLLCVVEDLRHAPKAKEILNSALDVDYHPPDRAFVLENIGRYDAFWGHFDFKVDKAIIAEAKRLRVVNTCSTGTDHIDKEELARRGIKLLCLAKDFGLLDAFTATAECAWMLLLACSRHFRKASRAALAGERDMILGHQLSGHTLGVLGVGRLGKMTIQYGKAFRMRVLGCDPVPFDIPGVERVDFDTLLRESDAVSIHIHLTPENYHLFNAQTLGKMKRGAILINTSRGDMINEDALLVALDSGALAAFGADVLHDEWRADMREQPVIRYAQDHDNVILTPHIGGATWESLIDARIFSARKLVRYLLTGEVIVHSEKSFTAKEHKERIETS